MPLQLETARSHNLGTTFLTIPAIESHGRSQVMATITLSCWILLMRSSMSRLTLGSAPEVVPAIRSPFRALDRHNSKIERLFFKLKISIEEINQVKNKAILQCTVPFFHLLLNPWFATKPISRISLILQTVAQQMTSSATAKAVLMGAKYFSCSYEVFIALMKNMKSAVLKKRSKTSTPISKRNSLIWGPIQ